MRFKSGVGSYNHVPLVEHYILIGCIVLYFLLFSVLNPLLYLFVRDYCSFGQSRSLFNEVRHNHKFDHLPVLTCIYSKSEIFGSLERGTGNKS